MSEAPITLETVQGSETKLYLPKLIELRVSFFRNYPYFYEGNLENEEKYVRLYANSEDSLLTVAKQGHEVIGIIAGLPLVDSQTENKKLFDSKEIPAASTFFLGEIVMAEKHHNNHLGQKLYHQLEESLKKLKKYDTVLVCEVERNDSKQKTDARSAATEWNDKGFIKRPELNVHYAWQEIGDAEQTNHLMVFWKKALLDPLHIAESYYQAMNEKNLDKLKSYLRADAKLISPMAGEAQSGMVLEAISRFMNSMTRLTIRSKFASGNQVMLVIDVEFPLPVGTLKSAVLMTFQDNLIASVELFHDTKPLQAFSTTTNT